MKAGLALLITLAAASPALAQDVPLFTTDFPPGEFAERRAAVFDAIGERALALVQGAPNPVGYVRFRQSNEFYYLSGVETPHAYLLLDGTKRQTRLYLPRRNEPRERSEGKLLSAEDFDLTKELTGVDEVHGTELLAEHLARFARAGVVPAVYTPFSPAEGCATSRDLAVRTVADIASDPWDGRPSREGHFINLLRERFPQFEIRDLSPTLDRLRLIKSPREITLIRKATRLSGLAIMEAIRSTRPGLVEHELDGISKFIFFREGAQADAYYPLIASGPNAWYPHYHKSKRQMRDGELILMDVGPDVGYYSTDVTRQWPVNGKFNGWQRELYGFYLACYQAILKGIEPGATPQQVKKNAARQMQAILARSSFSKPAYRQAAEKFVADYEKSSQEGESGLGHWIGMATHDVGSDFGPLSAGMVFTVEPALRVPEEKIYIRNEDAVLITETGVEILSAFVPLEIADIESLMREPGLLQRFAQPEIGRRRSP
jgi:Xaa-Pro aminopeptidase